jgi:large subunit ribosomal protein L49
VFVFPQSQIQGPPDHRNFVESADEYQFVERLLPPTTIPKPPEHEHYPTPSGWQPPRGEHGDGDSLKAARK